MKTFFTLLILVCGSMLRAQEINTVEYFFDTDPGIGNATKIATSGTDLDANFDLSVTGLSSGIHILNVRLKNSIGAWSTTYQSGILINAGSAGTQAIVEAEYYFDQDPGYGNGQHIALNQPTLDSVVNFSVTGLVPGAHTIFIRLRNRSNSWSYAYQGSFLLSGGTGGVPEVKSLEYFIDTDSGVNRNTVIALNAGASLDTTVSIPIPDNGGDSRPLGLRVANKTGQVGNVALVDISLCDLYKPKGGFRTARYGSTFSLISTAEYNPTGKTKWLVNDTLIDSSYTTNYTFPPGYIGTKRVTQVTGSGCRVDTVEHYISMLGVEMAEPQYGAYGGDYVANIYGGGLDTNVVVYLQKGDSIMYPYEKYSYDGNNLTAIFDFHGYSLRLTGTSYVTDYWQLHVVFPSGNDWHGLTAEFLHSRPLTPCDGIAQPTTCHNMPTEADPVFPTTLIGSTNVRTGVWSNQVLNITNPQNTVAKGVPFYLLIPSNFDVDTSYWNIVTSNPGLRDSINIMVPVDTTIGGVHLSYKLYALICPIIQGHQTVSYPFRIRTTVNSEVGNAIYHWADKNMFGSPFKWWWPPCFEEFFNFGLGFVPVAGCANATFDMTNGIRQTLTNHVNKPPDAVSMTMSIGGTALSCIPGGGAAKNVVKGVETAAKEVAEVGVQNGKLIQSLADKAVGGLQLGKGAGTDNACSQKSRDDWDKADILTRTGFDPNYLSGSSSYDTSKHFVRNISSIQYEVGFENKPAAGANAQHVMIVDTLNSERFAFGSFRLNGFSIADSMYSVPAFRYSLTRDVAIKTRQDMKVRFTADFDTLSGVLHVDYFSIDNNGHVFPPDSLDGFLPPNTDGVKGTGSVRFELNALPAATNDTFANIAHIYFDANAPVATNTWINTVDTTSPKSMITKALTTSDSTVRLYLQHSDVGSGLKFNEIFVKVSGDTLFRSLGVIRTDTVTFTGDPTKTYQFFTVATDNVNIREAKDSVSEVSVAFTPLPIHLLSFSGIRDGARSKLQWTSTNETNFSRYEVERSADGANFTKIGTVAGKGGPLNNNYQLYDETPLPKSNYYRLRQVDLDGSSTFSRVIRIDFDKAYTVTLTPIPAHNQIIIDGVENFKRVQLFDLSGRVVKQFSGFTGNTFDVSDLASGMYMVHLISDNSIVTLKMIKN